MNKNRQRVIDLLNTRGFEANEAEIKTHLEKLLGISLDGKIEFLASLDSLASLDRHASLASLDRHASLASLASLARHASLDRHASLASLARHASLASLDSLARLASLARHPSLASLDILDRLDIYHETAFSYSEDNKCSKLWSPFLDACESGLYQAFFARGEVFILKVPNQVLRDEQNRLHSDNQPAVIWLGEKIYCWHGIEIPARAIEDINSYTAKEILSNKNTEVRRALMSLYGYEKILPEVKAKLIDKHPDPTIGELYEFFVDGQKHHVAMVQDGTPMYTEKGSPVYRKYTIATRTSLNDIVSSLKDTYPLYRSLTNDEYLSIPRT